MTNALKGNAFLLKFADTYNGSTYTTVAALRSTGLTLNKTAVDITNKDGDGWMAAMAGGGVKSATISASGIYTDVVAQTILISAFNATTHWNAQIVDEGGNTFTGAWNVDSLAFSGEHNVEQTFEITLSSSGAITFA